MAEAAGPADRAPKAAKRGPRIVLWGLAGGLLLGVAAFVAVYTGRVPLPLGGPMPEAGEEPAAEPIDAARPEPRPTAFVPLDTMVISLAPEASARHLKITLQLDVDPERQAAVTAVVPRVADVLNTFLRAVDPAMLEQPRSMARLRAQMLRRVQLVAPPGAVRDLLIQEFVLD